MDALLDPWQDPVLRRAFAEVVLLGLAGGAIGVWVVWNGLSYAAESLSHALLPGLVVAALAGLPLVLGGAAGLAVAALAVALAGRVPELGRDTATAVVVTGFLGAGVLLALSPDVPPRLAELLFGDVLGTTDGALLRGAALLAVLAAALWVLHPRLAATAFDRAGAGALGLRAGRLDAALLGLLALVVLVATEGLGNLLVVSVLVAPAAAARELCHRLRTQLAAACTIAVGAGWAGLYVSFHARTAAGATIALVLVGAWLAAAAAARTARALPATG
ncbi:metal ABC transporter permease [Conexibacter sp. SYSU D00693]|uniref:metal ABC transporter permease n=1 Tax=Conexibacter sp. SYSU D00693 TaxID=2812560 RepID=UPI00196AE7AC|nr:metal ABC transporter permease [Conexibacter sp. SYSU D00693]